MIFIFKKRVESYLLEQVIIYFMIIFGFAAISFYVTSIGKDVNFMNLAIIEMMFIIILALLAQTVLMIRIYRQ